MNLRTLAHLTAGLPASHARRVLVAIAAHDDEPGTTLEAFKRHAAAAFEDDMKPVVSAVVTALQAGDIAALQGLRALLPHLLREVNQAPALADLLAHQLGKAVLAGMREAQP